MLNQIEKKEFLHEEMTVHELMNMWYANNKVRLKGGSINKYKNIIDTHIIPQLGHYKLSEMSSSFMNLYLNEKLSNGRIDNKGGLSPSYVNSIRVVIVSAIRFAVREELMMPFKTDINKPITKKKDLSILSQKDQHVLEKFIVSNMNPTNIGILISLRSGLRIGEICALKWEDIDLLSGIIYVRHTISRIKSEDSSGRSVLVLDEPKTYSSKREVPISSWLIPFLSSVKEKSDSQYVISKNNNFVSPRTYEYRYHKVLRDCNLPKINYHALRHTFATRCVEAGVDVKTLSEILGHSSVSITLNTYVHSSIDMKRRQIEKLTDLMR